MSTIEADELELARSLDGALGEILGVSRLLDAGASDTALPDASERALFDLGWSGIALSEDDGGLSLPIATRARLAAVAGRRLLPVAMRDEAFVLAPALAALARAGDPDAPDQLRRLLAGELRGGVAVTASADGNLFANLPPGAELLAILGSDKLAVVRLDRMRVTPLDGLDLGQGLARVELPAGIAPERTVAGGAHREISRGWRLALVSECFGAAQRTLELSVEYAQQREQFGQKIVSFQAVSHTLARMAVALEGAEAGIGRLCASLETASRAALGSAPEGGVNADGAGASDSVDRLAGILAHAVPAAARGVCESAIQVHGGVGFSWELGLHLYYRRVLSIQYLLGGDAASARAIGDAYLKERADD